MKYFAFGSNMLQSRLEDQKNIRDERIGSVQDLGTANLSGYRLAFNKIGRKNGISGKVNIVFLHRSALWRNKLSSINLCIN